MEMKVLLVYPEIRTDIPDFTGYYAEGPAILSAVLKQQGHQAELLHLTRAVRERDFAAALKKRSYDLLGFSALTPVFGEVKRLAPVAKEVRDVPVGCGGVHATLDPQGALAVEGIDWVCQGEGETALLDVIERLEQGRTLENIPNIWTRRNGQAIGNPPRPLVEDLDTLPIPDFNLYDIPGLFSAREGVATLTASRGCPYNCSYCSNHKVRSLYTNKHKYVRFKSVDRAIEEVRVQLSLSDKLTCVDFSDDIFILNKPWLEEFASKFPSRVGIPFICNALVTTMDEERIALLRQAGCTMVTIGLESGSERLRREVLHRPPMTNAQVVEAARRLREHGIGLATYNIIGLPTETVDEVLETIRLNARIRPLKINDFIFQPYPNTEIYDLSVRLGIYDPDRPLPNNWRNTSVLTQEQLPTDHVVFLHRYFKMLVLLFSLVQRRMPGGEARLVRELRERVLPHKRLIRLSSHFHSLAFRTLKVAYVRLLRGMVNRRAKEFAGT